MKILAVPTNRVFQGAALRRCPLCRSNLPLTADALEGAANCPNCGLNVKQLETTRQDEAAKKQPTIQLSTKPSADPLDRWLAGDAIEPQRHSEWKQVLLWLRKHPRLSGLVAAMLVTTVVLPIGLYLAYSRTAESLRQATIARSAAEQQRLELSEAVSRNEAELKAQQDRWQTQQQEHEWLKNQFRELQSNYQQSQQQVRIAENLLHGTIRESHQAPAEQSSAPAEVAKTEPPAAEPAPAPAAPVNPVPSAEPAPPEASPAPAQATEAARPVLDPEPTPTPQPVVPETSPAPPQAVQAVPAATVPALAPAAEPNLPAMSSIPAPTLEPTPPVVILAPVHPVQPSLHPASSTQVQAFEPKPPAANPAWSEVVPHQTPKSSFVIREVQEESLEVNLDSAAPQDVAPQDVPAAPTTERQSQDIVDRMLEMQSRNRNSPASLQKRKSELFRLD